VRFAALNPADRNLAMGQYPAKPAFPHILGRDGVGTVSAVGEGVRGISVGDTRLILRSEVGVSKPGTLAERVAVPAEYTVQVPSGWSLEQAAAAPLVYMTAWQALTQWGEDTERVSATKQPGEPGEMIRGKAGLPKDAVVLVTGASGGVGVAVVQMAHAIGYTVVALSRSEEKQKKLREMGAAITMDPTNKGWRKELKERLGARRVDLVVEMLGGPGFSEVIEVMSMWGKISVVGRLLGPVPEFNTATLFFRRLRVGGVALSTYSHEESLWAWGESLKAMAKTGARPVVDRVFGFDDVAGAFRRLEEGPMGKVVVKVE
jgi:NADPH:quinone reductase